MDTRAKGRGPSTSDEWSVIETLLPEGWSQSARDTGAFRRARYVKEPREILRLLLFHAVSGTGERETLREAKVAGLAQMSQVGFHKRLRTSGAWLEWIAAGLCEGLRNSRPEGSRRVRAIDSTCISRPGSDSTDWRLHYTIDLRTLQCDWHQLTDHTGGESLDRTSVGKGDVLLGDRNFLRPTAVRSVADAGGDVIVRLRWTHSPMVDGDGRPFKALARARSLRVGEVGEWNVALEVKDHAAVPGRVVATRLPGPVAAKAERKAQKRAEKKQRTPDRRSLEAAHFVLLFTTLSRKDLDAERVLELYRCRWQIELTFKRLKQLFKLGQLPNKNSETARSWIAAKLVVALVLETLYRNARALSPWGYERARLHAP